MNRLNTFEAWAKKTYTPQEASWKRPTLFILSLVIGSACAVASYTQINNQWTNNGIFLVIGLLGLLSIIGLFISIKCTDFWVALVLGVI